MAKLKDQLSTHLRAVEAGDEVEVTDRGRPIARIVPVRPAARVARSATPHVLRVHPWAKLPARWMDGELHRAAAAGAPAENPGRQEAQEH